tara:strand:+ start:431 stop:838 length:408 start_codon:yes stop_codon:yes gene_type:complete
LIKNNFDLKEFSFQYKLNTRFRDIDVFNHVNNVVFLTYFEDARRTFFQKWNINLTNRSLIVASIKVDYLSQLKHPSELIVGQKISRLGNTSFDIFSVLFLNNKPVCRAITTIVCYDFIKKKSVSLYSEIKNDYNK